MAKNSTYENSIITGALFNLTRKLFITIYKNTEHIKGRSIELNTLKEKLKVLLITAKLKTNPSIAENMKFIPYPLIFIEGIARNMYRSIKSLIEIIVELIRMLVCFPSPFNIAKVVISI